jgi:ATP phosphoribosyltransferase regulatory subunit
MNFSESVLKNEEKGVFLLRELYQRYGYRQYKMSKFEEYDLYAANKAFLTSDNIITFTDTNGRLMALKPDVTLSIVRGSPDRRDRFYKVFYDENVYRTAGSARSFREIPQTGLECIGPIDDYSILEVLLLASESLRCISDRCVLEISHLDVIAALIDALAVPEETRRKLLKCIGEKNRHELRTLCGEAGADPDRTELLLRLLAASGTPAEVLPLLRSLPCPPEAVSRLETISAGFAAAG